MTNNINQWIVGYGTNGTVSKGLPDSVIKYLSDATNSSKAIKFVELGRNSNHYCIQTEDDWKWNVSKKFSRKMHANSTRLAALY